MRVYWIGQHRILVPEDLPAPQPPMNRVRGASAHRVVHQMNVAGFGATAPSFPTGLMTVANSPKEAAQKVATYLSIVAAYPSSSLDANVRAKLKAISAAFQSASGKSDVLGALPTNEAVAKVEVVGNAKAGGKLTRNVTSKVLLRAAALTVVAGGAKAGAALLAMAGTEKTEQVTILTTMSNAAKALFDAAKTAGKAAASTVGGIWRYKWWLLGGAGLVLAFPYIGPAISAGRSAGRLIENKFATRRVGTHIEAEAARRAEQERERREAGEADERRRRTSSRLLGRRPGVDADATTA